MLNTRKLKYRRPKEDKNDGWAHKAEVAGALSLEPSQLMSWFLA